MPIDIDAGLDFSQEEWRRRIESGPSGAVSFMTWTCSVRKAIENHTFDLKQTDKFILLMRDAKLFNLARAEMGSVFNEKHRLDAEQADNPCFRYIHQHKEIQMMFPPEMPSVEECVLRGVRRMTQDQIRLAMYGLNRPTRAEMEEIERVSHDLVKKCA